MQTHTRQPKYITRIGTLSVTFTFVTLTSVLTLTSAVFKYLITN